MYIFTKYFKYIGLLSTSNKYFKFAYRRNNMIAPVNILMLYYISLI